MKAALQDVLLVKTEHALNASLDFNLLKMHQEMLYALRYANSPVKYALRLLALNALVASLLQAVFVFRIFPAVPIVNTAQLEPMNKALEPASIAPTTAQPVTQEAASNALKDGTKMQEPVCPAQQNAKAALTQLLVVLALMAMSLKSRLLLKKVTNTALSVLPVTQTV